MRRFKKYLNNNLPLYGVVYMHWWRVGYMEMKNENVLKKSLKTKWWHKSWKMQQKNVKIVICVNIKYYYLKKRKTTINLRVSQFYFKHSLTFCACYYCFMNLYECLSTML